MNRRARSGHAALRGKVVVITGASSGIGRAAALRFARHGCRIALAARRAESLQEVAECCGSLGASTRVVPTDMTRRADIERLVEATLARWGHIDIWVNNAGTTLFARLDEGEFDAHRQVLETNLIGAIYAARLVIPVFRQQRTGTLINVGSVLSQVGQAFVPSYVISKFGLQGLTGYAQGSRPMPLLGHRRFSDSSDGVLELRCGRRWSGAERPDSRGVAIGRRTLRAGPGAQRSHRRQLPHRGVDAAGVRS
jgi:hypothetical protein